MEPESKDIDIFHIVHLVEWFIFGYFFPNRYALAFLLMILWELFEKIISSNKILYDFVKKYWTLTTPAHWNETYINKLLDMLMNIIGYYIGSSIRTNVK